MTDGIADWRSPSLLLALPSLPPLCFLSPVVEPCTYHLPQEMIELMPSAAENISKCGSKLPTSEPQPFSTTSGLTNWSWRRGYASLMCSALPFTWATSTFNFSLTSGAAQAGCARTGAQRALRPTGSCGGTPSGATCLPSVSRSWPRVQTCSRAWQMISIVLEKHWLHEFRT